LTRPTQYLRAGDSRPSEGATIWAATREPF
jgi:hypothetical protein